MPIFIAQLPPHANADTNTAQLVLSKFKSPAQTAMRTFTTIVCGAPQGLPRASLKSRSQRCLSLSLDASCHDSGRDASRIDKWLHPLSCIILSRQ